MTSIEWDTKAREFLRKLQKDVAERIFRKVDTEIKNNVERFLEPLINKDGYKIRIGEYRLFVDFYKDKGLLVVRVIRHRRNAYKFS